MIPEIKEDLNEIRQNVRFLGNLAKKAIQRKAAWDNFRHYLEGQIEHFRTTQPQTDPSYIQALEDMLAEMKAREPL